MLCQRATAPRCVRSCAPRGESGHVAAHRVPQRVAVAHPSLVGAQKAASERPRAAAAPRWEGKESACCWHPPRLGPGVWAGAGGCPPASRDPARLRVPAGEEEGACARGRCSASGQSSRAPGWRERGLQGCAAKRGVHGGGTSVRAAGHWAGLKGTSQHTPAKKSDGRQAVLDMSSAHAADGPTGPPASAAFLAGRAQGAGPAGSRKAAGLTAGERARSSSQSQSPRCRHPPWLQLQVPPGQRPAPATWPAVASPPQPVTKVPDAPRGRQRARCLAGPGEGCLPPPPLRSPPSRHLSAHRRNTYANAAALLTRSARAG